MTLKKTSMCLAAVCGVGLAGSAVAQVYTPVSNKPFSAFLGTRDYEYVYDATTDAAGNRYVCGYDYTSGVGYEGFVLKITKKGFLGWKTTTSDFPDCVAADNLGNVYVGVPDNANSFGVRQINANTGGINYTSASTSHGGYVNDIAILPNGDPITASNTIFEGDYKATVLRWPAANNNAAEGWYAVGETSSVNKVVVGPDGAVYTAGFVYESGGANLDAQMMYIRPGFDQELLPVPVSGYAGVDEYLTDIAIDPTTNVALGVGQSYSDSFSDGMPWIMAFQADNSTSTIVGNLSPYYLPGYPSGSQAQGVVADNGSFAIAVTTDLGGTPGASVYSVGEYPSLPYSLYTNYVVNVPSTDTGTKNFAFDICADANGPILGVVSDLTIGTGSSSYRGVQTFAFSHSGQLIDRQIFGQHSIAAPYTEDPYDYFLRDGMSAVGGFLSIYAYGDDGRESLRTAQLKNGPDDSYRVDEDGTLTVGLSKSTLNNDGNGGLYDPLTAKIVDTTVSAGIHHVTFHDNGTFTATFNPNFNGVAGFNYKVKQNGVVIATNHVTINVKAKNDAPTAVDDSFNAGKNSAVKNLNVLGNDSDLDGDNVTILSKTNNANATIGITSDKKFITFKPKTGYTGNVGFDYTIRDPQGLQSTAHVVVHVS